MLKNEKNFMKKENLKRILKPEEIKGNEMQGEYFAIGDNGKAYHATYVNKYILGGVFYFCIPENVKILGYIPT